MNLSQRIVVGLLLCLLGPAQAVVNPNGVDWLNPSNEAFVTSAYLAVYGTVPEANVVAENAARLKSKADRYRFAKWLMFIPEYQASFGPPTGKWMVLRTGMDDKARFAASRDPLTRHKYPFMEEHSLAQGPARLLLTYWGAPGPLLAVADGVAEAESPAPPTSTVSGGPVPGRVYELYRASTPNKVSWTLRLTPERAGKISNVLLVSGISGRERGYYVIGDTTITMHTGDGKGLSIGIGRTESQQSISGKVPGTGKYEKLRIVRVR